MGACIVPEQNVGPAEVQVSSGLEEKMRKLDSIFAELDQSRSGRVDKDEFASGLQKFGLQWDLEKIKSSLGKTKTSARKGYISVQEFKYAFYMTCIRQADKGTHELLELVLIKMMSQSTGNVDNMEYKSSERKIDLEGLSTKLESKFAEIDADMDGLIDFAEFTACLGKLSLDWSSDKVREVMKAIGEDTINFMQFRTALVSTAQSTAADSSVDELLKVTLTNLAEAAERQKKLKDNKVKRMLKQLEETLDKIDTKKDGVMSKEEFLKTCTGLGITLQDWEIRDCLTAIDHENSGTLDRKDFRASFYVSCIRKPEAELSQLVCDTLLAMASNRKDNLMSIDSKEDDVKQSERDALIAQKFAELDLNKDGAINIDELAAGLKKIGVQWSDDAVRKILSEAGSDGEFSFLQFKAVMQRSNMANGATTDIDTVIKHSLSHLKNKGRLHQQFNNDQIKRKVRRLAKKFKKLDKNGDGKLDLEEFKLACRKWDLELGEKEIETLLRKMDADGNGTIELPEFKRAFSLAISAAPMLSMQEAMKVSLLSMVKHKGLKSDLETGLVLRRMTSDDWMPFKEEIIKRISKTFTAIDLNMDGVINKVELQQTVKTWGIEWSQAEAISIFRGLDTDGCGEISIQQFIKLLYSPAYAFPNQQITDLFISTLTHYAKKAGINIQFSLLRQRERMKEVTDTFTKLADSKTSQIDKEGLADYCKTCGLEFDESQVAKLFSTISNDLKVITQKDFMSALYLPVLRNPHLGIDQVFKAVAEWMSEKGDAAGALNRDCPRFKKDTEVVNEELTSKIEVAFALADHNKDGSLSAEDLATTCERLEITSSIEHCKAFISGADLGDSGELTIFDFSIVACGVVGDDEKDATPENILSKALGCLRRQRSFQMIYNLQGTSFRERMADVNHIFEKLDVRSAGELSIDEFKAVVTEVGLDDWKENETLELIKKLGKDDKGVMNKKEFLSLFYMSAMQNPDLSPEDIISSKLNMMIGKKATSKQFVTNCSKIQLEARSKKITTMAASDDALALVEAKFLLMDKNMDGYVDQGEFSEVLASLGLKYDEDRMSQIMKKLDHSGQGKISFHGSFKPLIYNTAINHQGWTVDQVLRTAITNL